MRRMYEREDPDCFIQLGVYQVCDATQYLSIFSGLFLLMAQALVSRILVPGKSNFVNASVKRVAVTNFLFILKSHRLMRHRYWVPVVLLVKPTAWQWSMTKSAMNQSIALE
jgi:hypothetical protein